MDFEQESDFVLSVARGQNNWWHVTAQDFAQPLAAFESPHDACAWAIALAKPKRGRVYLEEAFVDYSSLLEASERSRARHASNRASLVRGRSSS